jgi:hypothetical protein
MQQLFLIFEVVKDRPLADARGLSHTLQRQRAQPSLAAYPVGRSQQIKLLIGEFSASTC